jgi:hypothetical protein
VSVLPALIVHVVTSGSSDLSSWLVAGGTLALAIATAVLAWKTRSMANETRELAQETRDGIDSSAVQFRQERMPVVMPLGERRTGEDLRVVQVGHATATGRIPMTLPYAMHGGNQGETVIVPIENVGAGPALGISGELFFLDQNGAASVAPQPPVVRNASLPALGPGQTRSLRFEYRGLALPLLAFELILTYQDGAGGDYGVRAVFVEKNLGYGQVGFDPPPELQLPGSKPPPIPRLRLRARGAAVDLGREIAPDMDDLGIPPEDNPDGVDG